MLATGEIGRGLFEEVDFGRDTGLFLAAFDCFFITMGGMLLSCIWIKGDGGMVSSLKCPVFKAMSGFISHLKVVVFDLIVNPCSEETSSNFPSMIE